jgi:hypothetical protein
MLDLTTTKGACEFCGKQDIETFYLRAELNIYDHNGKLALSEKFPKPYKVSDREGCVDCINNIMMDKQKLKIEGV